MSVRCDPGAEHVDRQECLSYQTGAIISWYSQEISYHEVGPHCSGMIPLRSMRPNPLQALRPRPFSRMTLAETIL